MALTLRVLRAGTLATETVADMYPTNSTAVTKNAVVKNIILTNKSASAATANLVLDSVDATAGQYQLSPKDISIPPGGQVILDAEITLNLNAAPPSKIKGNASANSAIDYIINGMERDI